jgi:hypothetical protein
VCGLVVRRSKPGAPRGAGLFDLYLEGLLWSLGYQKYLLIVGMVARDGIEPPTPAFSGLPDNSAKWLGISGCT